MTDLVLDASVALSWCLKTEASTVGDRVLERLEAESASVPAMWQLEIANVLALSERRGRITPAKSSEFTALLETLDVVVDDETPSRTLDRMLDLARAERLRRMTPLIWSRRPARHLLCIQGRLFMRCRRAPWRERAAG